MASAVTEGLLLAAAARGQQRGRSEAFGGGSRDVLQEIDQQESRWGEFVSVGYKEASTRAAVMLAVVAILMMTKTSLL